MSTDENAWIEAVEHYIAEARPPRPAHARRRGRHLAAAAGLLVLVAAPLALASGEGEPLLGGARNPSPNASAALNRETEIIAQNGTYGTRQSNKSSGDGGGAIYGCRSAPGREPCVRAVNLRQGRAFEYETGGAEAGRIQVGDVKGRPFTTNAQGVATGLNADQVDGRSASDFALKADTTKVLWASVNGTTGVVSASNADATGASSAAGTYTVTFKEDVSKCGLSATATTINFEISAAHSGSDSKAVNLSTSPDGIPTASPSDFSLAVFC